MLIYVYERCPLQEVVRQSRCGPAACARDWRRSPAIARAAAASRNPRLFVLLRFNAFVDAVFRREGADYGFPLNPKHAAAALRLSQNRPRPAPISILSALP